MAAATGVTNMLQISVLARDESQDISLPMTSKIKDLKVAISQAFQIAENAIRAIILEGAAINKNDDDSLAEKVIEAYRRSHPNLSLSANIDIATVFNNATVVHVVIQKTKTT